LLNVDCGLVGNRSPSEERSSLWGTLEIPQVPLEIFSPLLCRPSNLAISSIIVVEVIVRTASSKAMLSFDL
jgi:hypothetical protein